MTSRRAPPDRRESTTLSLKWPPDVFCAPTYFISTSVDDTGKPVEMFVGSNRPTSASAELARDASIIISLALQHGATVEGLCRKVSRLPQGEPSSLIGAALDAVSGEYAARDTR